MIMLEMEASLVFFDLVLYLLLLCICSILMKLSPVSILQEKRIENLTIKKIQNIVNTLYTSHSCPMCCSVLPFSKNLKKKNKKKNKVTFTSSQACLKHVNHDRRFSWKSDAGLSCQVKYACAYAFAA